MFWYICSGRSKSVYKHHEHNFDKLCFAPEFRGDMCVTVGCGGVGVCLSARWRLYGMGMAIWELCKQDGVRWVQRFVSLQRVGVYLILHIFLVPKMHPSFSLNYTFMLKLDQLYLSVGCLNTVHTDPDMASDTTSTLNP